MHFLMEALKGSLQINFLLLPAVNALPSKTTMRISWSHMPLSEKGALNKKN